MFLKNVKSYNHLLKSRSESISMLTVSLDQCRCLICNLRCDKIITSDVHAYLRFNLLLFTLCALRNWILTYLHTYLLYLLVLVLTYSSIPIEIFPCFVTFYISKSLYNLNNSCMPKSLKIYLLYITNSSVSVCSVRLTFDWLPTLQPPQPSLLSAQPTRSLLAHRVAWRWHSEAATVKHLNFRRCRINVASISHCLIICSCICFTSALQVPPLTRHPETKELHVNLDPLIFQIIQESVFMTKMKLKVPRQAQLLLQSKHRMCRQHAQLVNILTDNEKLREKVTDFSEHLFNTSLKKVRCKISIVFGIFD